MAYGSTTRAGLAARVAGFAAAACFAGALFGFGAALEGFRHDTWPVAVLGASGVPRAGAFNACAYLLPGLLAAFVALRARAGLPSRSGLPARVGWTLALLAAFAFAAQGLFPLDPAGPDAGRGRLHGVAWALWGIAFAAAAATLALAAFRQACWVRATLHLCAGVAVSAPGWMLDGLVGAPLAQRLAFGSWFAWLAWVGWARPGDAR
ncbi:MAG TPA: DUF998 domain-containing protein [Luteimonas sp.]